MDDPDLRITIKLTNFLFLVTKSDSNWTDIETNGVENFPKYKDREVVSVKSAYEAFVNYMESLSLPFEYDHAIGFTNKDLWSEVLAPVKERSSLTGYSHIGGICQKAKYSIVEEQGGFASARVSELFIKFVIYNCIELSQFLFFKDIAHELGHK